DGLIVDGIWGTIKGLGTLVGFQGLDAMGQAWKGLAQLATGLLIMSVPVVGAAYMMAPDDKLPSWLRDSRTAVKETGKALVAWDEWGKNPARAAGAVTFNVVTTVFTGGAGAGVAGAGKAGAVAKTLSALSKAGKAIDPMTYITKAGGAGLTKLGDVMAGLKGVGTIDIPPLPDTMVRLPEGSLRMPDGSFTLPEGAAIPEGAVTTPTGALKLPEGWTTVSHNSVALPDGRVMEPDGSLISPNGAVDPTPVKAESVPAHAPAQQPVLAGVHAGDSLPAGSVDSVPSGSATDHVPGGATGEVPAGTATHTPGTGPATHVPGVSTTDNAIPGPSSAGHDLPPSGPHGPGHDGPPAGPASHADDGAHVGDDAAGHGDDAVSHADDAAGHGDDGVHGTDPDHSSVVDDAAHGVDESGTPGAHGSDASGDAYEYKPHMSADEFDALPNAEKHRVAAAELSAGTLPFADDTAAIAYGRAEWNQYVDDLDPSAQSALRDYTGDTPPSYIDMNGLLRGDSAYDTPAVRHDIAEMDRVMSGRPVPDNIMVVRGTGLGHLNLSAYEDMVGRTYPDQGYLSTSLGNHPVPSFAGKEAILHLRVPQGTPALWLEKVSKYDVTERELLLARGSEYKVTRVFVENGQVQVYGEVLPRT
ncbi:ADP-ribosyltransferase, partial [Streptomyces mesophilus]|uniref:ADP-ribosyltransferase n=1 Tax=Streptomyces mesophilus TaxID=1775132 RepID=UPI0033248F9B